MAIHDWIRVEAGIFHHFHHTWITEIQRALNRGLLPLEYRAFAEQIVRVWGLDVLTLQQLTGGTPHAAEPSKGVSLATTPPRVQFHFRSEPDPYAAKVKAVVIRHVSNHRVVAVVEIVSPGNKNNRHGIRAFVTKAVELLRGGIHLLIVDLFAAGPRDPQGIHKAIWDECNDNDFALPPDKPLTLVSYIGGPFPEAFIEPTAVGIPLAEMPLFLTPDVYIPVPLEATYQSAWADVPAFWRDVLTAPPTP